MEETELLDLTKQCLSIVKTATLKDDEIKMWINAAIVDLKNKGIDSSKKQDSLIQSAIVMFVKSNFGSTDIKEKQLAKETYDLLCVNLSLNFDYKIKEEGVDSNV